ncbi:hypothetical protein T484DRAFT_1831184 [Baffinella frigidus]|nr:hypothetical protein T484DRAFT_1831184 [Cryptophyta sp. CCMP2293]
MASDTVLVTNVPKNVAEEQKCDTVLVNTVPKNVAEEQKNVAEEQKMRVYFSRFGKVARVIIDSAGDRGGRGGGGGDREQVNARVTFTSHESAQAAIRSVDAVLSNRFIMAAIPSVDAVLSNRSIVVLVTPTYA